MKKLVIALVALLPLDRRRAGPDRQGSARDPQGEMEQADRAVQDDRQRLLCRNRRPGVLPDHVAAGPYPGRYGDAGSNVADQGEHRETRLQGHRHQISRQHPRAYRSHRRPCRNEAGQRRPDGRGRSRQAAARRRLLSGRAGRHGARVSAGEGRSHGARRRQGHAWAT